MALPWSFASKITNSKHQITNKSQIPIFNSAVVAKMLLWRSRLTKAFKDTTLYVFSNFGHWKLFDIWELILGILKNQRTSNKANPLWVLPKPGPPPHARIFDGPGYLLFHILGLKLSDFIPAS
jgi:hypothetical protein